jgi:hypothetical protein
MRYLNLKSCCTEYYGSPVAPIVPILSLQCIQCKVWSQCPVIVCLMQSEFYRHSQFPLFEPTVSVHLDSNRVPGTQKLNLSHLIVPPVYARDAAF